MCSISPSPGSTTRTSPSNVLEVWFVCHPCKLWFKNVPEIIEHKKECHFEEFQETKIIVFEEAKLGHPHIESSRSFPTQTDDASQKTASRYLMEIIKVENKAADQSPLISHPVNSNVDLTKCEYLNDDESCPDERDTMPSSSIQDFVSDNNSAKADLNDFINFDADTNVMSLPSKPIYSDDLIQVSINEKHFSIELKRAKQCSEIQAVPTPTPNPHVLLRRLTLAETGSATTTTLNHHNSVMIEKSAVYEKMLTDSKKKLVGSFKCDTCDNSFSTKHVLLRHMHIHSDHRPFKCHLCDNSFKYKCVLKRHVERHSDARPFKCLKPSCGKDFKCKASYKQHLATHEKKKSLSFKCAEPNCGKTFRGNVELKRHITSHCDLKNFTCNYPNCGRKYKRVDHLKIHVKRRHTNPKRTFESLHDPYYKNEDDEEILKLPL